MARAFGSYPNCRWFKSDCRYHFKPEALRYFYSSAASNLFLTHKLIWPGGQAVKTPPFHGGNTSSILVRVTTKSIQPIGWVFFTFLRSNKAKLYSRKRNSSAKLFLFYYSNYLIVITIHFFSKYINCNANKNNSVPNYPP